MSLSSSSGVALLNDSRVVDLDDDDERWNDETADFRLFGGGGEFVDADTRRLLLSERFGDDESDDAFGGYRAQTQTQTPTQTPPARAAADAAHKSRMPRKAQCVVIGNDALLIDLLLCRADVTLAYVVAERSFDSSGEAADKAAIAALVDRLYKKYLFDHRRAFDDLVGEPPEPQAKPKCQFETSLDKVLMRPEINVVVVATPLKSRRFFVEAAIAAGKLLVLCKRPIVPANDAVLAKLRADARAANVMLRDIVEPRSLEAQEKKAALEELKVEPSELRHETRDIVIAAAIGLVFSVFGFIAFVRIKARHARVALTIAVVCNITLIAIVASAVARRATATPAPTHAHHNG
jgi:hypothetical protein